MTTIARIVLRHLNLPLIRPYRLSYRTFNEFEPFFVSVEDEDGNLGFADGHISPGSSSETREGGWAFLVEQCEAILGMTAQEAIKNVSARFADSKVAATALVASLEVLARNPMLRIEEKATLPLLTPINATRLEDVPAEVESWYSQGFRTFKVKVGKDIRADLARLKAIQEAVRGRAKIRIDANRAYSREDAIAFVSTLDPEAIELFEQPCEAENWDANSAVAAASPVPIMLDEPICTIADIEHAGSIPNVRFCKLKLKRFGGLSRLKEGLEAVYENGMEPVLGDGLGSEVHNWLEACVARDLVRNAGEYNGFIKPHDRMMTPPILFFDGSITLPVGYNPQPDWGAIERFTVRSLEFTLARTRSRTA